MGRETEAGVIKFLNEFKIIAKKRGVYFVPREEFVSTLISLGITRAICKDELLSLSVDDYCRGPENDRDRPGRIWVFGKRFEGRELYIKLKIAKAGKETIAKCLSFHPAEFPLCFPFRPDKEGKRKMKKICPYCEAQREIEVVEKIEKVDIRGEPIEVISQPLPLPDVQGGLSKTPKMALVFWRRLTMNTGDAMA